MKKWQCGVCGYIHEGDEPPEKCPVCGAEKSLFEALEPVLEPEPETRVPDELKAAIEKGDVTQWRCTVCGYIHEGTEPPEKCPVCGADKSKFEPVMAASLATAPPDHLAEEEAKPQAPQPPPPDPRYVDLGPLPEATMDRAYHMAIDQMLKHHAHPISVHIPNGVLPVSFIFIILASLFGCDSLGTAALCNMVFVLISLPFVIFSGYIEWQKRYKGVMTDRFLAKIVCATVVAVLALVVVIWWTIDPDVLSPGSGGRWLFIFFNLIMLAAAAIAGLIGGKFVFRD